MFLYVAFHFMLHVCVCVSARMLHGACARRSNDVCVNTVRVCTLYVLNVKGRRLSASGAKTDGEKTTCCRRFEISFFIVITAEAYSSLFDPEPFLGFRCILCAFVMSSISISFREVRRHIRIVRLKSFDVVNHKWKALHRSHIYWKWRNN